MSTVPLRLLSLCSGIGGIDYAWSHLLGQAIVGQVELDPYCRAVLAQHWPTVPRCTDLKELAHDDPFADAELVAGGIPCQPFSRAGRRRGTADDRHLWPHAFALITRRRPRWVLIENVAGFTDLALDLVQADLESAGYQTGALVLPACAIGAPHERQRLFILAHSPGTGQQTPWTQQPATAPVQCGAQLADPNGDRRRNGTYQPLRQPQCNNAPHAGPNGTAGNVAHSHRSRSQIGDGCKAQGRAPAAPDRCAAGPAQPRVGRGLDGLSHWLDSCCWPSGPQEPQAEWEPARVVTGRIAQRGRRLKALGNAVVPQQVLPLLAAIVALESESGQREGEA